MISPPTNNHIVLLYSDRNDLPTVVADYINAGLDRGQFCVYATVHFRDEDHIEKVSSLIKNYRENVEKGNLLVVDLAPYYISAMMGDMKPFDGAKKLFAEKVKERADKHVRFVGDGTGFLFKNRHFDECAMVEQWWQEKPFEGSYVCPYPKSSLETDPNEYHARHAVMVTHDVVIDISGTPLKDELYKHQETGVLENEGEAAREKYQKRRLTNIGA